MKEEYVSIKQTAAMVRDISLIDVMDMTGSVRDKYDKSKWHTAKGPVSVTGQKFMNWKLHEGGFGAIDLIIHLEKLDFKSAVIRLADRFPYCSIIKSALAQPDADRSFQPPKRSDRNLSGVLDYLHNIRKIPKNLLHMIVRSGKLYADWRSNAVFLLLGKEKNVVGAELRGTSQKRWVGMASGSDKNLGAFSVKAPNPGHVLICESAVDAVSYFALHPDCIAVSTAGATPAPSWLYVLVNLNIDIFCGFDDDECGNRNADEMICLFPKIKRLKPEKNDWNEVLKSI